jgi:tripartite-type tricarboxylate transporter receptor subunit TctC
MIATNRRSALIGLSATVTAAVSSAYAQTSPSQTPAWPTRPVRIIVPVAAGTATDLTARIFGERLASRWGQGVVVEPKPGADGLIALAAFVSATDEHTLLFSFSTAVSLNPLIHAKLSYDPAIDLVPITTTSEVLFVIAVNAGVGASTIPELSAVARANPGKLNWASAPGLPRFVFERFRREQGLDMAYVPYTQTGAAIQDLGEGRLQLMIASLGSVLPVIEAGKARPLVMASSARSMLLPSVEHAGEAGIPTLAVPAVGCVFGWRGMPAALRDRIAADIDQVARDEAIRSQLAKIGQEVHRSTPGELSKLLARQRLEMKPIAEIMAQSSAKQ